MTAIDRSLIHWLGKEILRLFVYALILPMGTPIAVAMAADEHALPDGPSTTRSDAITQINTLVEDGKVTNAQILELDRGVLRWDEMVAALSFVDDSGALWKTKLAAFSLGDNTLGRPVRFAIESDCVLTPFNDCLLFRRTKDGWIDKVRGQRLPARISQVSSTPGRVLCAIDENSAGERAVYYSPLREILPLADLNSTVRRIVVDSDRAVTTSDDGTMRLWDVWPSRVRQIASYTTYPKDASGQPFLGEFAAFSPYSQRLATVYEHTVIFRSPKSGDVLFTWAVNGAPSPRVAAIRFDPSGNNLYAFLEDSKSTSDASVKFFQYDDNSGQSWPYQGKHGVVDGRATSDGNYVITWDGSPEIVFWDANKRTETAAIKVAPKHVFDVTFSRLGDVMVTAGDDGEIRFWNVAKQSQYDETTGYRHKGVRVVRFSDDGQYLATLSDDGWLRVWAAPAYCHESRPTMVAHEFGPNSTCLKLSDGTSEEHRTDGTVIKTNPDGTTEVQKQH